MVTKKCSKCRKEYNANLLNFLPDKRTKDSLTAECRNCKKERDKIYSRQYRENHQEWKKEDNKRNADLIKQLIKEYNEKYPERKRAANKLNRTVMAGKLKRGVCAICGNPKIHGHHQDYSKPLDVIWLCAKHHKAIHNNLINFPT